MHVGKNVNLMPLRLIKHYRESMYNMTGELNMWKYSNGIFFCFDNEKGIRDIPDAWKISSAIHVDGIQHFSPPRLTFVVPKDRD